MKSPIILGTDMTKLKESTLRIIKNKVPELPPTRLRAEMELT